MSAAAAAALCVHCGGDDSATQVDGGAEASVDASVDVTADVTADAPSDAGSDAGACDRSKPFGTPVALAVPQGFAGFHASMTEDELELFYQATLDGGTGTYVATATRATAADTFGSGTAVGAIDSSAGAVEPSVSADGLTLFFSADGLPVVQDGGCCSFELYMTTRASRAAAWGTPVPVPTVDTGAGEQQAFLRADGKALYFTSRRDDPNGDIYRSSVSGGVFGAPVAVTEINSGMLDGFPAVTEDDLIIFWSSHRTGTNGGPDIWTASRASTADPFGSIRNVTELNTSGGELVAGVSPDGCRLYYSSANKPMYADRQ